MSSGDRRERPGDQWVDVLSGTQQEKKQAPWTGPLPTGHTKRSERIPLSRHTSTSCLVLTFHSWMIRFSRACVKGPSENIHTAPDSFMRVLLMWFLAWSSFMGIITYMLRACVLFVISQQERRVHTDLKTQTPARWCLCLDQTRQMSHQPKLMALSTCSDPFSSQRSLWNVPNHCRDLIPY